MSIGAARWVAPTLAQLSMILTLLMHPICTLTYEEGLVLATGPLSDPCLVMAVRLMAAPPQSEVPLLAVTAPSLCLALSPPSEPITKVVWAFQDPTAANLLRMVPVGILVNLAHMVRTAITAPSMPSLDIQWEALVME
jgi:hypothetical protein